MRPTESPALGATKAGYSYKSGTDKTIMKYGFYVKAFIVHTELRKRWGRALLSNGWICPTQIGKRIRRQTLGFTIKDESAKMVDCMKISRTATF